MAAIGEVDMVDVARKTTRITVTITRKRELMARMWLVGMLLRVVGWVAPMPVSVEMGDKDDAPHPLGMRWSTEVASATLPLRKHTWHRPLSLARMRALSLTHCVP